MCGVAGVLSAKLTAAEMRQSTERMLSALVHRGPDDQGLWLDDNVGISLGHRRLSILDLSPLGHQPMHAKRFSVVFNGEIYNFKLLRKQIEASFSHRFLGRSDTEVLLAAFEYWGVEKTLAEINGMFAIALWDRQQKQLHLMRDRMGEKPLIYGLLDQSFTFASEVRALASMHRQKLNIDQEAIALMARFNNIPAPRTIFRELRKLEPGSLLTITPDDVASSRLPEARAYWSCKSVFDIGWNDRLDLDEHEAVDRLDHLLLDSTMLRLESDVPVGAFLSGGIDSSLTVALMQKQSASPVRTFTVGFEDPRYSEAEHARKIAEHLGTRHTELPVTDREVLDAVPRMATVFDEPFSDSSQVPTYLISRLTRQHVTVSLSGDGGDELFAGYNRYATTLRMWNRISPIPGPVRQFVAAILRTPSPALWTATMGWLARVWPAAGRGSAIGFKIHKFARMLATGDLEELYSQMISQWQGSDTPTSGRGLLPGVFSDHAKWPNDPHPTRHMMLLDCLHYLPDEILVKVDRAAMAVSLETRIPFLDHRVVEFSSRLPMSMLQRDGRGKYILRKLLERYVPLALFDRPKQGFNAPIQHWLRGPLRGWAEDLLAEDRLKREGHFAVKSIRNKWRQHLNGYDCSWELWSILMFQSWLEGYNS